MARSKTYPRGQDHVNQLHDLAQRMFVQQVHDVKDHVRAAVVGHDEFSFFFFETVYIQNQPSLQLPSRTFVTYPIGTDRNSTQVTRKILLQEPFLNSS